MSNVTVKEQHPVAHEATAVLSMIERVACDPSVDVMKLEKMLDLQERVLNRQAEQEFYAALNACQRAMGRISADAENPQTRSRFASYAALDRALRPIYTEQGLSISYDTVPSQQPEHITILAYVSHPTGFTRRYSVDMPTDGKGAKGNSVMTTTHATGAAMSYGMRYLLKMIFNVAVGESDTDGNLGDSATAQWVEALGECKTMAALQATFTKAWKAVADPNGRKLITMAKDNMKKALEVDNGTAQR
jgi:hypothetical protein